MQTLTQQYGNIPHIKSERPKGYWSTVLAKEVIHGTLFLCWMGLKTDGYWEVASPFFIVNP